MIRALIVEDDPLVGRALGRALSRHVDVVDVVRDADAAIQRMEHDAVDVVVTDYDLGPSSRNGVELAARIREQWPEVPIVMASGSVNQQVRATARQAGIDECFTKPVPIDALATTLRGLVERRRR